MCLRDLHYSVFRDVVLRVCVLVLQVIFSRLAHQPHSQQPPAQGGGRSGEVFLKSRIPGRRGEIGNWVIGKLKTGGTLGFHLQIANYTITNPRPSDPSACANSKPSIRSFSEGSLTAAY